LRSTGTYFSFPYFHHPQPNPQESLAATYGAGISNACVVDIGATTTSIACVDEGLVIADTRWGVPAISLQPIMTVYGRVRLGVGGDDITELLYVLLKKIRLPYREMDLVRSYDWNIMEELKTKICTLTEVSYFPGFLLP
jgi:actin-related protein 8